MSKGIDDITALFLQHAVEDGDPDHLVSIIGKIQEMLVAMFTLYIVMQGKEHKDHDCDVFDEIPAVIESFKRQLIKDIDTHIAGNMIVNGITLIKSVNEKTYDEIMAKLKQSE